MLLNIVAIGGFQGAEHANIFKIIIRNLGKIAVFYYSKCLPYSAFESKTTFKNYKCIAEVLITRDVSICFMLVSPTDS